MKNTIKLPSCLKHMITHCAGDNSRYAIAGVLLHAVDSGKAIDIVALDGHRMAILKYDLGEPVDPMLHLIIPSQIIKDIKITAKDEYITLIHDDDNDDISLRCGKVEHHGEQETDAKFPPYEQVRVDLSVGQSINTCGIDARYMADAANLIDKVTKWSNMTTNNDLKPRVEYHTIQDDRPATLIATGLSSGLSLEITIMPIQQRSTK